MTPKQYLKFLALACAIPALLCFWFFVAFRLWGVLLRFFLQSAHWRQVRVWFAKTGMPQSFLAYYSISIWIGFLLVLLALPLFFWLRFNRGKRKDASSPNQRP